MAAPNRLSLAFARSFLLLIAVVGGGVGCKTTTELPDADTIKGISAFETQIPGETGWKEIRTYDEVRYVATPETKFDEDIISIYARMIPLSGEVVGTAGLRAMLDEGGDPSLEYLQEEEHLGTSVVRFKRYVLDSAGNPKDVLQVLRLRTRPQGEYYIRGEGVIFIDPKDPKRAFEVGVMRNSFHGEIGASYQQKGEAFIDYFLLKNDFAGFSVPADIAAGPQS
jgi:hypothetical protein